MAVTKIIPIRTSIEKSVEYIYNPAKTDDCLLIHSEHCFPQTAALTFQHYLQQARAGGNTIGRHLIQSFAPGEVTPETAHEIGKRLVEEILKGEYAYVMATHVDRGHVHNHFVWCAVNIITHKKYRSNKNTYHDIRKTSDRLCEENNLSIIMPQGIGKSYTEYNAAKQGISWKEKLKTAIDILISESADFEDLLKGMESQGYEIKKGKYISFRAPEQERFTRAKSLGENYTEEALTIRISQKSIPKTSTITLGASNKKAEETNTIRPFIDIKNNPKFSENRGLEQWAKVQNLKNLAASYNLMQEYGGMEAFNALLTECRLDVEAYDNAIEATKEKITVLIYLRDDITKFNRTKPIYKQYAETKFFPERFRKKHEDDIIDHENAMIALQDVKKPLPKAKEIDNKIKQLKVVNSETIAKRNKKNAELQQFNNIHKYLYQIHLQHQAHVEKPLKPTKSNELDL